MVRMFLVSAALLCVAATAQQPATLRAGIVSHADSGTSLQTLDRPQPMLMQQTEGWMLMLHGAGFLIDTQQRAGAGRGGDKLFSTNAVMAMAQHPAGSGDVTLRAMLSLEPATVTGRKYPELFEVGETAYGHAIVDGQHPHNFVMELAALYDHPLGSKGLISLYAAPVGDPAIGPTAYPHRASAAEDPIAPLGHHQQDSTHVAFNVLTAGLTYRTLRIEGSGFHGAEPGEARWALQSSPNGKAVDSYSARWTWMPVKTVAAQYSMAHIASPESLDAAQDQTRQTASVAYNRRLGAKADTKSMPGMTMTTPPHGEWATTLVWGRTKALPSNLVQNSYLLESLLRLRRNAVWTRVEVAARTTELLSPAPATESALGHVQAYTVGYDREYRVAPHVLAAPGAQFTLYRTPAALAGIYSSTPFAAQAFVRFRISE